MVHKKSIKIWDVDVDNIAGFLNSLNGFQDSPPNPPSRGNQNLLQLSQN